MTPKVLGPNEIFNLHDIEEVDDKASIDSYDYNDKEEANQVCHIDLKQQINC